MSFPRYPAYKDSGVPWLGEVPAHWEILSLKRLFTTIGDRATDRRFAVALENIEGWTGKRIEIGGQGEFDGDGVAFRDGDILYGKLRPYLAKTWLADREGEAVGDFHVLRAVQRVEPAFYRDLLLTLSVVSVLNGSTQGAKMPRVGWAFMGMMKVPQPPLSEQRAITAFVEREAAKLASLVAEQEDLLALLEEKQAADVSHLITKGLDPSAEMMESGVPWVGCIPKHWNVAPLMRLVDEARPVMYGIVLPGEDVGVGVPIVKGGNVKPSRLNLASLARTTPEIEAPYARARLRPGDLVYAIRGTIGDCEPVPPELEGTNITQDVARVAPREGVNGSWLRHALLSKPVREALACGSLGAAVRGINIFDLKRVRIPVPPPEERDAIAFRLDEDSRALEALAAEARASIALLRERRAALVFAAVTGRIDVRAAASLGVGTAA